MHNSYKFWSKYIIIELQTLVAEPTINTPSRLIAYCVAHNFQQIMNPGRLDLWQSEF